MAVRTGAEFLDGLGRARTHVEIQGETLTGGVATHPAFRNVVRSYAELFDMQHDPAYRDVLTYPSPLTGDPVGTSFLVPRSEADLMDIRNFGQKSIDEVKGKLAGLGLALKDSPPGFDPTSVIAGYDSGYDDSGDAGFAETEQY